MIDKNNAQIQITGKHPQKGSCVTQLGEIILRTRNLILNTRNITKRTTT